MPVTLSTTTVLALFYTVFLSQIFLVSIYYPAKLRRRVRYVRANFPPERYPKLYPAGLGGSAEKLERGLEISKVLNLTIAAIGLIVLLAMALSGYRPDLKGGDEIFVMMYFFLQACPLIYAELRELKQYRLMRETFADSTRKANLSRRRLFDFISPAWVIAGVVLYFAWLFFYLYDKSGSGPLGSEVYATLAMITGMNVAYALVIARFLLGKKLNPYQAYGDQLKHIEAITKVLVFSSIFVSVFSICTIAADRYGLEVLDPPLVSVYLQVCLVFGVGLMFRTLEIEGIDFEVYREDAVA